MGSHKCVWGGALQDHHEQPQVLATPHTHPPHIHPTPPPSRTKELEVKAAAKSSLKSFRVSAPSWGGGWERGGGSARHS